jgi:hypothetical protein
VSVVVLSGSSLQATTILEGPLAPLGADADMKQFQVSIDTFENNPKARYTSDDYVREKLVVNFEHDFPIPDDDNDDVPLPQVPETLNREEIMARYTHAKQRRENAKRKQQGKKALLAEGEPNLFTNPVPKDGWYRACIKAHVDTVDVEWELRKESQFGMDGDHVLSLDEFLLRQETFVSEQELDMERQEERRIMGVAAEDLPQMIKDDDFKDIKDKISDLRGKLAEIQSLMQRERRRVTIHKQTNEHSHSQMWKSSMLETLLFVAVTVFQLYLIRSWFTTGNPVLGR